MISRSPKFLSCALLLAACAAAPAGHAADAFPSRPITVVVGYPPGGGPDQSARLLADRLAQRWGQPVVVENRAGVSGMIGAMHVAKSAADGHTLLFAPNTFLIAPLVLPRDAVKVDVLRDFTPVIAASRSAMVMVAHPSLGVKDAKELTAYLKQHAGLAYATPGTGSPMHIAGELFKKSAGVDMLHVPYKGVAPALADVVGGHVKISFAGLGVVSPHVAAGRLVAVGLSEDARTPLAPQIPTLAEQGYANTTTGAWYGMFAPKQTPAHVVAKLNAALDEILKEPDTATRMKALWEVPVGGSPAVLGDMAAMEGAKYARIVKEFNISAE